MSFNPFLNSSSGGSGGSGEPGKDGRGITSIIFTSSNKGDIPNISGATDTYKVSYTDGTTSNFTVYNGEDGKEVELKVSETAIQWRYNDDKNWTDLILLSELKGLDGQSVSLRIDSSNNIQWKKDNDTEWTNLISLTELKGSDGFSPILEITAIDGGNELDITDVSGTKSLQILNGSNGKEIELGKDDINIKWRYVGDNSWKVLLPISSLKGKNGTSITSIAFTSSDKGETAGLAGATDTYTITLSDNTTSTFSVYNGKDGSGGSGSGGGFSGDYNDLINKPTIPVVSNDLTDELKEHYDLAYAQIHTHDNKPVLDLLSESDNQELKYNSENVYKTKILTKAEYDSEKAAGSLKENWIYVVSDEIDTPQLEDSGWNTFSIVTENTKIDSTSRLKYRKIGKVVYIEGYVILKNESPSNEYLMIGTLPSGFCPTNSTFGINTPPLVDGNNVLHNSFVKISSSGAMILVNTGESLTNDLHYFFNISYLCD